MTVSYLARLLFLIWHVLIFTLLPVSLSPSPPPSRGKNFPVKRLQEFNFADPLQLLDLAVIEELLDELSLISDGDG